MHSQLEDAVVAKEYVIGFRFPRDITVEIEQIAPEEIADLVKGKAPSRSMTKV